MPEAHGMEVSGISFNPVSQQIMATCSLDKSIRLWNVEKLQQLCVIIQG